MRLDVCSLPAYLPQPRISRAQQRPAYSLVPTILSHTKVKANPLTLFKRPRHVHGARLQAVASSAAAAAADDSTPDTPIPRVVTEPTLHPLCAGSDHTQYLLTYMAPGVRAQLDMLTSLPPPLLALVASHLDDVADLLRLHRICPSTHRLRTDSAWCVMAWKHTRLELK